jgi:hypothetical protein
LRSPAFCVAAIVHSFQTDHPVQWHIDRGQLARQRGQMRQVPDHEDIVFLERQGLFHPGRRIARLKSSHHLEPRERIAETEEILGGLARAELAAVPDRNRPDVSRSRLDCQPFCLRMPQTRKRATRVHCGTECVGVMHKKNVHGEPV